MSGDALFHDLLRRARAGDADAAGQLVRLYEPEIRRCIRIQLTNPRLRRAIDSSDIFQSVFANFYVRLLAGQFDLTGPGQLIKLLTVMARHRIIDHARRPANRATDRGDASFWDAVPERPSTHADAETKQGLLDELRRRLTHEELALVQQRANGKSWEEIADGQGVSPDAMRKRHGRAIDRVCQEMGVSGADYG